MIEINLQQNGIVQIDKYIEKTKKQTLVYSIEELMSVFLLIYKLKN